MKNKKYGLDGSEILFDSPAQDEIVPQFLKECSFDGHYYALPYMRSTEACYINKTYVEKLGYTIPEKLTWDFVWEVAEAATAKDADGNYLVNGQKVMIPFIYKSTDNMMIQMLKQQEAGYSTKAGDILIFNDTTRALLENIAVHAGTGAFSTFKISSYPANFLNAGQCIFAIDSTAGATWMGCEAPNIDISEDKLVQFETVIMPIPQFDTENPQMISQGPSVCVFNKEDPQEVMASWIFTQYLITNEVQIAYSQTEGYVPVTEKAQESEEYQAYLAGEGKADPLYYPVKLQAAKLLLQNTENTFVTPVFNGSASLRNAAGQLVEETVKGMRRGKTADAAFFDGIFQNVRSLYKLDQLKPQPPKAQEQAKPSDGAVGTAAPSQSREPLPLTSVLLLGGLGIVWVFLGLGALLSWLKKRKKPSKS